MDIYSLEVESISFVYVPVVYVFVSSFVSPVYGWPDGICIRVRQFKRLMLDYLATGHCLPMHVGGLGELRSHVRQVSSSLRN